MCAAARDNPTTADETNSFERKPRNVKVLESRKRYPSLRIRYQIGRLVLKDLRHAAGADDNGRILHRVADV